MKLQYLILWFLQLVVAVVLIPAAWSKFIANPVDVLIFTQLGMEPTGRILIAVIELASGLFLLTNRFAVIGAFITIGTMLGAIIAHASVLGFNIQGDGGLHIVMLILVFSSAFAVTYMRRKELPLIGNSF